MARKKHTGEFTQLMQFYEVTNFLFVVHNFVRPECVKFQNNLESRASKMVCILSVQVILCEIDVNLYCLCHICIMYVFTWIYADYSTYRQSNLCKKNGGSDKQSAIKFWLIWWNKTLISFRLTCTEWNTLWRERRMQQLCSPAGVCKSSQEFVLQIF